MFQLCDVYVPRWYVYTVYAGVYTVSATRYLTLGFQLTTFNLS